MIQEIRLIKGNHLFIFRYDSAERLPSILAELAFRGVLDWFEAAVVLHDARMKVGAK